MKKVSVHADVRALEPGSFDYVFYVDNDATDDEIKQHMDANGYISGLIYVPVSALIHLDFETFLDTISTKLVGSPLLSDVDYNLIGTNIDEDALIFKVSGNTELLFNEN